MHKQYLPSTGASMLEEYDLHTFEGVKKRFRRERRYELIHLYINILPRSWVTICTLYTGYSMMSTIHLKEL